MNGKLPFARVPGRAAARAGWSLVSVLTLASTTPAAAQRAPADGGLSNEGGVPAARPSSNLRGRFGTDVAVRLVRSVNADERLHGLERLSALHTPEALALLERTAGASVPDRIDSRAPLDGAARSDPRALLVAVRGLSMWVDRASARSALAAIVSAPTESFAMRFPAAGTRDPSADEAKSAARLLLARQEAAIALAESGNGLALDALVAIARSGGPGQEPALEALAIYPPASPLLGGVVLTTPATIVLAAAVGDLRSLAAIEAAMSVSDPAVRAAALVALGGAGDSRIIEAARAALRDRDARVRLAAGDALVRLGVSDAALAVEGLVGDDSTALDGLRLAQLVQGDGVTKAVAARAIVSDNAAVRGAAVVALGRQAGGLAVGALATLAADPALQGDVACALARSPGTGAMAAIEAMGGAFETRRLAARAYLVRRMLRRERSRPLEALLQRLAASNDPRDRAVGVQALVALGEHPVAVFLKDADPRVRRAAAMGALGQWDVANRSAILEQISSESDAVTQQVLAVGLLDGDSGGAVPTEDLAERVQRGAPDAPLAALALARRGDERRGGEVDAILEGPDPVLRAHIAQGLGSSPAPDALGRLAYAYTWEGDAQVRRAVIAALAAEHVAEAAGAPVRRETLELAARLDPDRVIRWTAARALEKAPAVGGHALTPEVSWLRLVPAEGATLPTGVAAVLVQSNGVALPIVFDDDGYALVPGVAPGEGRLRLAARPPPYEAVSQ